MPLMILMSEIVPSTRWEMKKKKIKHIFGNIFRTLVDLKSKNNYLFHADRIPKYSKRKKKIVRKYYLE